MRAFGAVVGGEGNGGVILPAAHYGRDGLVAAALVCQALAAGNAPLRTLADALPKLCMVKDKLARADEPWEVSAPRLRVAFPDHAADAADGLRLTLDEEWVHIRPSGTEPVVRVIAESPNESRTRELIERARRALQLAS
jgi:phosphomannomutase